MANEKLDLIDRNELLPNGVFYVNGNNPMASLDELLNRIATAQTVDAVEVVHGEWDVITDDCTFDTIYQCSVCKEEFVTIDGTPAENLWHYCPNCGAKMDGGNEDG